jgi:DNA-binding CsgD family transcriptional regulator/PAS domain-containing protein
VIDLAELRFAEVNDVATRLFGLDEPPVGREVLNFSADRAEEETRLCMLADGRLDGYEATWPVRRADGTTVDTRAWVRVIPDRDLAVLVATHDGPSPSPLAIDRGVPGTFDNVTVAFLDDEWRVARVTADIVNVLGWTPEEWIGKPLLGEIYPGDAAAVLAAAIRASEGRAGVEVICRMRAMDGSWRLVRLGLLPAAADVPTQSVAITLSRLAGDDNAAVRRPQEAEDLLWRLATELQAVGVISSLRGAPALPDLAISDLSTRQWEIVTRLLRGERVPSIARAMYLSQSTVRNHLTAVFRRFDVHSQEELLRVLRERFGESVQS